MKILRAVALALALLSVGQRLVAQDSVSRIQLGVKGSSRGRQSLVVLAGRGLDSVRTIVERDLEFSDRYTVVHASDATVTLSGPFNPLALKESGVNWVVELQLAPGGVFVKLYDMATGAIRQQGAATLDAGGIGDTRITIHRVSDQIVAWIGGVGIAATRIAFKNGKDSAIWRIDSDGANVVRVSRAGSLTMTPAWSPDGSLLAYSEHRDGSWVLYLQRLNTGTRNVVPMAYSSVGSSTVYGPSFSPDGKTLVFSHGPADALKGKGYDIESADVSNVSGMCCAHRLTFSGTLADNLSPTYSPDGRRIALVSNRTGKPEIWVMDADGTGPSQPVPAGYSENGRAFEMYTPGYSPDGTKIAFGRDTENGGRQLYYWSVGSGSVQVMTSQGRNEDPSWAPDSRHVVFKSTRSGSDQLWIFDLETGSFRQLTSKSVIIDGTRYPAWSRTLGTNP